MQYITIINSSSSTRFVTPQSQVSGIFKPNGIMKSVLNYELFINWHCVQILIYSTDKLHFTLRRCFHERWLEKYKLSVYGWTNLYKIWCWTAVVRIRVVVIRVIKLIEVKSQSLWEQTICMYVSMFIYFSTNYLDLMKIFRQVVRANTIILTGQCWPKPDY